MTSQPEEFSSGVGFAGHDNPNRSNPAAISLNQIGQSWTSQVTSEAGRPTSLLQPLYSNTEGIGMDAATAARRFPDGQLPANPGGNGQTEESIMPSAMLRMTSGDTEAS
jgi:hypothetical protein